MLVTIFLDNLMLPLVAPIQAKIMRNAAPAHIMEIPSEVKFISPCMKYAANDIAPATEEPANAISTE